MEMEEIQGKLRIIEMKYQGFASIKSNQFEFCIFDRDYNCNKFFQAAKIRRYAEMFQLF